MKKHISCIAVCLTAFVAFQARAIDQYLNDTISEHVLTNLTISKEESFWEIFKTTYNGNSTKLFWNGLNPLRVGRTLTRFPDQSDQFRSQIDDAAKSATRHSFEYSFREAFLDSPGMIWLKDRSDPLAVFFKSSIGNVTEEEIDSQDVTYRPAPDSFWRSLYKEGIKYGVRPFRTSPYVFVGYALGDKRDPIVLFNLRYFPAKEDVELMTSFPLTPSASFQVGTSYEVGRHGWEPGMTVKLNWELPNFGAVFLGWGSSGGNFFAGCTMPF